MPLSVEEQKVVAELQEEIREHLTENIVGRGSSPHLLLSAAVAHATSLMQSRFPDWDVQAINPRFENNGKDIVWDGWSFTKK